MLFTKKVLSIILISFVLLLSGCSNINTYQQDENTNIINSTIVETKVETTQVKPTETEKPKYTKVEEVVLIDEQGHEEHQYGTFSYKVPRVALIKSDYVDLVNKEIKEEFETCRNNPEAIEFTYEVTGYYNIVSLVLISTSYFNNYETYKVFNFDLYSGEKLSNSEVCSRFGLTDSQARNGLVEAIEKQYIESYNRIDSQEMYDKTLSDENLNSSYYYIDKYSNLSAVVTFYAPVQISKSQKRIFVCLANSG